MACLAQQGLGPDPYMSCTGPVEGEEEEEKFPLFLVEYLFKNTSSSQIFFNLTVDEIR